MTANNGYPGQERATVIGIRRHWRRQLAIPAALAAAVAAVGLATPAAQAATSGPCYSNAGPSSGVFAATCWNSAHTLIDQFEEYAVPANPTKTGALFSIWGGLQDPGNTTVLQNMLTWDINSWVIYPEYYYGGRDKQGIPVVVYPGDTIVSSLTAYNCNSSGACTWNESIADETTGYSSPVQTVTSGVSFTVVIGGELEVHTANGCIELPANGHIAFRGLQVEDSTGAIPTPNFGISMPDHQCSMTVRASATGADFLWPPVT